MAPPATITLFTILRDTAGVAISGATVRLVLDCSFATVTATGDSIDEIQQTTTSDPSGRAAFTIVCNDLISPANTTYTMQEPHRSYQVAPQSANGASQQATASNVIVNVPTALAPTTSSITGNLSISGTLGVTGLLSANGGLTVTGTFSIPSGGFSMAGPLTLTAAASSIIPGATSFAVRDAANANNNLLVSNAGVLTVRAGVTITAGGLTITAGNITASAGNSNLTLGTGTITSGATNSQTISAAASLTGTLTVATGFTLTAGNAILTAGNLTLTAGNLTFAAASAKIVPGATSLLIRNNADSASNLALTDAGLATLRNALSVPPSAGAALPTTAYGTLPVKLDDQSTASGVLTLTIPSGYRTLEVYFTGRSSAGEIALTMQLSGDVGNNYDASGITDINATVSFTGPGIAAASARVGVLSASTAAAGAVSNSHIVIQNADSTTLRKVWTYHCGHFTSDAAAGAAYETGHGQWRNTTGAVTSIVFTSAVNARAIVYGLP